MIKTGIKILVTLAVLNAVFRAGLVAWDYFQLRDEAQQLILFGGDLLTDEIADQIYAEALERSVPLERENIDVQREGNRTFVDAYYTESLEFFPTLSYPLDLSFSVETFSVGGAPAPGKR